MRKHWVAGALLALPILMMLPFSPLADARGQAADQQESSGFSTAPSEGAEFLSESPEGEEEAVPAVSAPPDSGDWRDILPPAALDGVSEESRDAAAYTLHRGLLALSESGDFDPAEPASRGEAVAALYRLSGMLLSVDTAPYPDVPEDLWDAVAWASSAEVAGGVAEDRFAPGSPVTRSQLAVMLHRFAAWRGEDTESRLALSWDGEAVPSYAEEAVNWVVGRGLYGGMTDRGLYPSLPVSRLQLAEILARLERDRDSLAASLYLPESLFVSRSAANHEALSAQIEAAARRYGAVGVQVAVVERGAVTDTYHYGWSVKGSVPMTDQHKMRTASLSKVAVGLSAALLQEEGVVDYDADIGTYWGTSARNPRHPQQPVTIRSILTHTSTLLNGESISWSYSGVKAQMGCASGYGSGTPGDLKSWSYNNHAFGILGQTLELAAGRYLDDVLAERVLAPVGADCAFAEGDLHQPELISPLYRTNSLGRSAASLRSIAHWDFPGASGRHFAGGFTSSAQDFAKLVALLAGDGCFEGVRLMEEASADLMEGHSWQALPGGTYQALPMRFRPDLYGREGLYYHTGSAYGVYNLVSYDPISGDGVVVLTMGASGKKDAWDIYAICGEITQAVYDAVR